MTGRVYLLPIPALAGALLPLHGGGEAKGGRAGGLEPGAASPVASCVGLDASGLRVRSSGRYLVPPALAASGTAKWSRPRLCPLGPSTAAPSVPPELSGCKRWEKGLKTGGALLLPRLTVKRRW